MASKKFQRVIENFVCAHCSFAVRGNGYTNHCPRCLYSRHVDQNPGDRGEKCGGMMRPFAVESKGGEYIISHVCEKCGITKRVKSAKDDNFEEILKLI